MNNVNILQHTHFLEKKLLPRAFTRQVTPFTLRQEHRALQRCLSPHLVGARADDVLALPAAGKYSCVVLFPNLAQEAPGQQAQETPVCIMHGLTWQWPKECTSICSLIHRKAPDRKISLGPRRLHPFLMEVMECLPSTTENMLSASGPREEGRDWGRGPQDISSATQSRC